MSHRSGQSFDGSQLSSQSPVDLRLRSEMWKGQVPVMFQLAPHEVTGFEDPPPLVMLVPRMSYFPLVLGDVRTHFRDMTPAMEDELWLEYEGIPLKWTIPIGVLFDLLCPSAPAPDGTSLSSGSPSLLLPWRLTVHFQSFPLKKLQRCKTIFTVRQHYLNTWKESCYVRFQSSRIAMSCLASDHQKMWDALTHLREDIHVATNARIVTAGMMGQAAQQTAGGSAPQQTGMHLVQAALEYKSVEDLPIRIYLHCTRPSHEEGAASESHMCPLQRAIKPKGKDGHENTVKDLIQQVLPALIDKSPAAQSSTSPSAGGARSSSPAPSDLRLLPNVRLLVQGFSPPLSTPLPWLCTYCSHPDGFLYLSVQLVEAAGEGEELHGPGAAEMAAAAGMAMHGGLGGGGGGSGHHGGGGGGSMSGSMFGGMMGGGGMGFGLGSGLLPSFHPTTLPGYHAAHNAVNVVYQNLPSLPVALPSVASIFGGSSAVPSPSQLNEAAAVQQPSDPHPPFSSAPAMDSPTGPTADDSLAVGDIEAFGGDDQQTQTSGQVGTAEVQGVARGSEAVGGEPITPPPMRVVQQEEELP